MTPLVRAWIVAISCLLAAATADAHGRSVSYSTWSLDASGADVRARISRLELTRLALDPTASRRKSEEVGELLAGSLRLASEGRPCAPEGRPVALPAEANNTPGDCCRT